MSHWKASQLSFCCLAVAMIAALSLNSANAQQRPRDSGAKARGEFGTGFWTNQRASRSIQHARDYSRDLYRYSRDATAVSPEVAKSESENLGKNIESAKKELATVAKQYDGDKEVQAALETISKHLAKAAEVHDQLHQECCKDAPDGGVTMECCSDITKELDKAAAEHAALMRTLEQRAKSNEAKPDKE
ncbi:MAG: hypothetical protein H6822_02595 [Planctomycetaceae bacterium]|nr:hypothetical protein [Planctomycetales bacterium]MCB9921040.1 hypothetical protein [Planctomycetaceae bacterium]